MEDSKEQSNEKAAPFKRLAAVVWLAAGMLSISSSGITMAQEYPNFDRPLRYEEAKEKGYFQKIKPSVAPGYQQRIDALEERREMFPPEKQIQQDPPSGQDTPTYDPRTHEYKGGKLIPKPKDKDPSIPTEIIEMDLQGEKPFYLYDPTYDPLYDLKDVKQVPKQDAQPRGPDVPTYDPRTHKYEGGKLVPKKDAPPLGPSVPTYDTRTHEYRGGKLVPKPKDKDSTPNERPLDIPLEFIEPRFSGEEMPIEKEKDIIELQSDTLRLPIRNKGSVQDSKLGKSFKEIYEDWKKKAKNDKQRRIKYGGSNATLETYSSDGHLLSRETIFKGKDGKVVKSETETRKYDDDGKTTKEKTLETEEEKEGKDVKTKKVTTYAGGKPTGSKEFVWDDKKNNWEWVKINGEAPLTGATFELDD